MTPSKADRVTIERLTAAIERLTAAIDALTDAISGRTKQLKPVCRGEMQSLRQLTSLVGVKPKKQPTKKEAR